MMQDVDDRGMFQRAIERLFGKRADLLTERITSAHWLSYLLIVGQSIAIVFVFGRGEVGDLWAHDVIIQVIAAMLLFLLGITVIASDVAMLRSYSRLEALARNRQFSQWLEHVAYILFVLIVEGATYGVVLAKTEGDPTALTSGQPLIPTNGPWFWPLIVLRVILTAWATIQLNIVHTKLPVLLSTLNNTGKEILGGHLERAIKGLNIGHMSIAGMYRTFSGMAQPPRPIPGFWDAVTGHWITRRAMLKEAEEARQSAVVFEGFQAMELAAQQGAQMALPPPTVDATPDGPPDGPGGGVTHETDTRRSDGHSPRRTGQLTPFSGSRNPRRLSPTAEAARKRRAYALLDATPDMSKAELRRKLRSAKGAADGYWADWHAAHRAQQAG